MLDDGVPAQSIMVALKLGRSTYFQWTRKYQEHGLNGLKVRPLPGAASKLTDQQTSQLRGWLVGRDPRQFQFDFALWTLAIHSDLAGACAGTEKGAPDLGECGCRSRHSAVIEEHLSGGRAYRVVPGSDRGSGRARSRVAHRVRSAAAAGRPDRADRRVVAGVAS